MTINFSGNEFGKVGTVIKGTPSVPTSFVNNIFDQVDTVVDASGRERAPLELLQDAAKNADVREALVKLLRDLEVSKLPVAEKKSVAEKSRFFSMSHAANTATVVTALAQLDAARIVELLKTLSMQVGLLIPFTDVNSLAAEQVSRFPLTSNSTSLNAILMTLALFWTSVIRWMSSKSSENFVV